MITNPGLLRAVCQNPSDDVVRLAYSDWLEEHGEQAYADFIRIQIALEDQRSGRVKPSEENDRLQDKLESQEYELLLANWHRWINLPKRGWHCGNIDTRASEHLAPCLYFRRGFVSDVNMTLPLFTEKDVTEAIFNTQPVTNVTLYHKSPMIAQDTQNYVWSNLQGTSGGSYLSWHLPKVIFDRLLPDSNCIRVRDIHPIKERGYRSRDHALNGLCTACVRYGRNLAGLSVTWRV